MNNEINMDELRKLTFTDSEGKDQEYELLVSFQKNGKVYYIMTDNIRSESEKLNTYVFYMANNDNIFRPLKDEAELNMVNEVFEKIQRETI